jgi:hypothetical protein
MRALAFLIPLAGAIISAGAAAEPTAVAGFDIEVVRVEGAMFSGLGEKEDVLVVTNLADGRIYLRRDGAMETIGSALPHGIDVIGDPTGPYHVAFSKRGLLVTQGWTPAGSDEGPLDHALLEVTGEGEPRVISNDFWNPFDFVIDEENLFLVDAAKNSIERLRVSGEKTTIFTFARIKQDGAAMQALSPTEFSAVEPYEVDAVPTGIALRGDHLFVSLFSGFPYLDGGGRVVSLGKSGGDAEARTEIDGLNSPVDLGFRDGRLLVLEHGRYLQGEGFLPGTGRLIGVDLETNGSEVLVDALTRPASFVVRENGGLIIAALDGTLTFVTPEN